MINEERQNGGGRETGGRRGRQFDRSVQLRLCSPRRAVAV